MDGATAEQRVLASTQQRFPAMPPNSTLLLDGVCPYAGPAVVFEANWDLWTPESGEDEWHKRPTPMKFIAREQEFDEGEA